MEQDSKTPTSFANCTYNLFPLGVTTSTENDIEENTGTQPAQ